MQYTTITFMTHTMKNRKYGNNFANTFRGQNDICRGCFSAAEVVFQQNPLEIMKHYFELLRWIINELWSSQINLKPLRKTYFSTAYCADTILCTQLSTNLIIRMSVGWTTAYRLVDYIYFFKKSDCSLTSPRSIVID